MKLVMLVVALAGCGSNFDFDLDFKFGGPIEGDKGVATFRFVDGCPGEELIWGCPVDPALAVGAHARFVATPVDAAKDAQRVERAHGRSASKIATATVDGEGLLVVDTTAEGSATIQLVDDGDVVDEFTIPVAQITSLRSTQDSNVVLAGPRIGARVRAGSAQGLAYGHGAIQVTTEGALTLVADTGGESSASDQATVVGLMPGPAAVTFTAGDQVLRVPYEVVTRADVTRIDVGHEVDERDRTRTTLYARAFVGDAELRGGPACDWQIVKGHGSLFPQPADDTDVPVFATYDAVTLRGTDDVLVECRANLKVAAQILVHLKPSGQGPSRALLEH